MGFFTQLQERYLIKPVADRLLKSLTKPLNQIAVQNGVVASEGLQTFAIPVGFNSSMATYNKRMTSNGGVDWAIMRSISVNHETTRAAINVRKREITQLNYEVVDLNDDSNSDATQGERNKARALITNIGGDGVRFREILDKLIEDTLVLDACVFYKQRTRDNKLLRIIPIDGGTIKLRVDESGMTPVAPEIAYEQWIRGEKTADLTTEDLSYEMMNPRSDNPYGLAPIESLIMTLDSSMRAMLYNLSYLSDNSVPQGFLNIPENWNINQIKEYTEYLHAMISGPKAQAKIYPIPAGSTYVPTSKPTDFAFKDFFDYLDRKVCMVFDVTPQELGLSLQQYKENGETQDKIQTRKGIKPLANFLQEIFTDLLRDELGYPNYAFKFTGLDTRFDTEDAKTLIPLGVLNIDEVRNDRGLKKLGAPNIIITPGAGITPVDQIEDNAAADLQTKQQAGQPKENLNAQGTSPQDQSATKKQVDSRMQKINRNLGLERLEKSAKYKKFHNEVKQALTKQILPFTREATIASILPAQKADVPEAIDEDAIDSVLPTIKIQGFAPYLQWVATQGGQQALDALNIKGTFFLPNPKFQAMLGNRENYLIDSVDTTTKQWIVDQLSKGHADGLTNAEIARNIHDELDDITLFRANMITNTETANAVQTAELDTYKEQGVTQKVWVLSEDIGDECGENADQGAINVDDEFSTGDQAPPAHPNCRCYVQADVTTITAMDNPKLKKGWITINGAHVLIGGDTSGSNGSGQPTLAGHVDDAEMVHQMSSADEDTAYANRLTARPESISHGRDFSTPNYMTNNKLSDAEHELKYNAALQAEKDYPSYPGLANLIRNANVNSATNALEMGQKILEQLPANVAAHEGVKSAVNNWAKTAQMMLDYRK